MALTGASVTKLAMDLESMVRLVASAWSDVDEVVDVPRAMFEKAADGAMAVARKMAVVIVDFIFIYVGVGTENDTRRAVTRMIR